MVYLTTLTIKGEPMDDKEFEIYLAGIQKACDVMFKTFLIIALGASLVIAGVMVVLKLI